MMGTCQFCNLASGIEFADIVYQTNFVCCFLDIDPIHEGHTLIVPKKHILDIEEADEMTRLEIMNAAALLSVALKKCYSPDGISTMQNGGYFNDVNHYHMHVFPRYKNDGFGWVDPQWPHKKLATASQVATHLQKIIIGL
ncbi:MAG: HIT family protein [Legionella sp.]|uniref:HIT family protein n=1 Tax=Legionella sp. TaxID=459 RepID=UPI0039E6C88B